MGDLCEDFKENWPRYNGTALYFSKGVNETHADNTSKIVFDLSAVNAYTLSKDVQVFYKVWPNRQSCDTVTVIF